MKKLIPNYENYYVDEYGNVYNSNTNLILKGSIGENGYKYYRLSKNNVKERYYAHRLVAENFLTNENQLPIVNHIDGNKLNNFYKNLEWVSAAQNAEHAHRIGLISNRNKSQYYVEDLPNEEWKQLYNLPYSISNCGRVRNDRTNLLLSPSLTCGYLKVRPCVEGKAHDIMIHNAVYCIFNNLNNIPLGYLVDHINGIKTDNNLQNLRLVTRSENTLLALYEQHTNKTAKAVAQYDLDGNFIKSFMSISIAAKELNLDSSTITKVCKGINKTHGGFIFKYL